MVQVIEQSGWGSNIGKGLGQGISAGIEDILQNKMDTVKAERGQKFKQQEEERKQAQEAEQVKVRGEVFKQMGYHPGLASLDPGVQKQILQSQGKEEMFNKLTGMLGGTPGESSFNDTPEGTDTEDFEIESKFSSPLDNATVQEKFFLSENAPNYMKSLQADQDRKQKERLQWESGSKDLHKKFFENIEKTEDGLADEERALKTMRASVDSKDFSSWRNVLAEKFDFDKAKTTSGQVFNSAAKDFLIKDIMQVSGPKNQFLEKNVLKGLPNVMYSPMANDIIQSAKEYSHDLKKRKVEITRRLQDQYHSKGKEVPRNFKSLVMNELKSYEKDLDERYTEKLADVARSKGLPPIGEVFMKGPDGQKYSIPEGDIIAAGKEGYKLIK